MISPETGANQPLRIGHLASQTGVSVEALRYYERRVRELRSLRRDLADAIAACDANCPVGDVSRNIAIQSSDQQIDTLACPLVEAFDADVSVTESKSRNGSRARRDVAQRRNAKNRPSKPGRRTSP